MILRLYSSAIVLVTMTLLVLSIMNIPHLMEIIFVSIVALFLLLLIVLFRVHNKVTTRYEHARRTAHRTEDHHE